MVIRNQYLSMQSREALFDIALVVYRVGSSGRESKANHPQTLIPLMIMEINLGSPQDASVAAPFHFSFHRCNDVPRVCLSFRLSSPLAPLALSSLFLTRPPPRMHARARRSSSSLSFSPSSHRLSSSFSSLLPLLDSFSSSPRPASPVGSRQPLLYQPLLSTTLALPRSSNLPIVRFRRIRPTVMDYRSAHGRRTLGHLPLTLGGIVIAESSLFARLELSS